MENYKTIIVALFLFQKSYGIQVRLADGVSPYSGRVEVKYNNTWGTVCGYLSWDIEDAHVVCHMLNYTRALAAIEVYGGGTGKIWMWYVACTELDKSLDMCSHYGWGSTPCGHFMDAAVVCSGPQVQNPEIAVRLVDGSTPNQGRVEIRYYGIWGTVCIENWNLTGAHVICRMLNYSKALWTGTATVSGNGPILLKDVRCEGDENTIKNCSNSGWGKASCGHWLDVGVECLSEVDPYVRLANGVKTRELYVGILQVNHKDRWGTVCSDGWTTNNTKVVCRQMGYQHGIAKHLREGTGTIWLDNVVCAGDENSVVNCRHRGWGSEDCEHTEDVGIVCFSAKSPNWAFRWKHNPFPNAGQLEVRYYGTWGTLCADNIGLGDGHVICRMMGYRQAAAVFRKSLSTSANAIKFSLTLSCNGNENSTEYCNTAELNRINSCGTNSESVIVCMSALGKKSTISTSI